MYVYKYYKYVNIINTYSAQRMTDGCQRSARMSEKQWLKEESKGLYR